MPDMEKVIKGLEHCKEYGSLGGNNCDGYYEYTDNLQEIIKANNHRKDCLYGQCKTGCVVTLIDDTLELLKAQRETIDELISADKALKLLKEQEKTGHWIYKKYDDMFMCSCCEKYSIRNDYPYCHWCGAKMECR